jgi:hypothetical protein
MRIAQIVKGMTKMTYSKNVICLANDIASHYAKIDIREYRYTVDIDSIADFDLQELAALMMSEDASLASEATGSDNPYFKKTMLPALTHFLTKSTDKDEQIEFMSTWKECVTGYFKNEMIALFESAALDMNENLRYVSRTQREEDQRIGAHL